MLNSESEKRSRHPALRQRHTQLYLAVDAGRFPILHSIIGRQSIILLQCGRPARYRCILLVFRVQKLLTAVRIISPQRLTFR